MTRTEIRGSVVSLSYIFLHPPKGEKEKKKKIGVRATILWWGAHVNILCQYVQQFHPTTLWTQECGHRCLPFSLPVHACVLNAHTATDDDVVRRK